MTTEMVGVVLWCDKDENAAVIWCEDHGNLAYYRSSDGQRHDFPCFDAGDLVAFECLDEPQIRRVSNLRRLTAAHAPALPDILVRNGTCGTTRSANSDMLEYQENLKVRAG